MKKYIAIAILSCLNTGLFAAETTASSLDLTVPLADPSTIQTLEQPVEEQSLSQPVDTLPAPENISPYPVAASNTSSAGFFRNGKWVFEGGIVAGGAGASIPVNETLKSNLGVEPAKYRFHVTGEGFSGGAQAGIHRKNGKYSLGLVAGIYQDAYSTWNRDHKNDIYSHDANTSSTFLDRSYTLEFALRFGKDIQPDLHVYGKLGTVCSAFQYKLRDPSVPLNAKRHITAWGGLAGVGIQKDMNLPALGLTKLGLEYTYHIYETLTPVVNYAAHKDTSKLRPRYQNAYLTLSKSF